MEATVCILINAPEINTWTPGASLMNDSLVTENRIKRMDTVKESVSGKMAGLMAKDLRR